MLNVDAQKCKLLWHLHPVPTTHNDSKSNPSLEDIIDVPEAFMSWKWFYQI